MTAVALAVSGIHVIIAGIRGSRSRPDSSMTLAKTAARVVRNISNNNNNNLTAMEKAFGRMARGLMTIKVSTFFFEE